MWNDDEVPLLNDFITSHQLNIRELQTCKRKVFLVINVKSFDEIA